MYIETGSEYIGALLLKDEIIQIVKNQNIKYQPDLPDEDMHQVIIDTLKNVMPKFLNAIQKTDKEFTIGSFEEIRMDFMVSSNLDFTMFVRPQDNNNQPNMEVNHKYICLANNTMLSIIRVDGTKNMKKEDQMAFDALAAFKKDYVSMVMNGELDIPDDKEEFYDEEHDCESDSQNDGEDLEDAFVNNSDNETLIQTRYIIAGSLEEIIDYINIFKSELDKYIERSILFKGKGPQGKYQLLLDIKTTNKLASSLKFRSLDHVSLIKQAYGQIIIEDHAFEKIMLL